MRARGEGGPRRREPERPIRFGTSGWRGMLGDEVTFARVRAVAAALAERVRAEAGDGARVLVAHDRRFLGEELAALCAEVLAGAEVRTLRADGPLPTPAASFAVRRRRLAAGLVVTASHNPPAYQGLKVLEADGGSAGAACTADLERRTARQLRGAPPPQAVPRGRPQDLLRPYLDGLARLLGTGLRGRRPLRVEVDALHGMGAGCLDRALARGGARVGLHRGTPDARFGGGAPDPVPERLGPLRAAVRRGRGLRLGLATDGDADRFAAVDEAGRVLSASDALALLVEHGVRTGRIRRGVAVSIATGSLVTRVAEAHGLRVEWHPIGFKHLTAALLAGRVDAAGEESGGFAWGPLARDKDGVLAGCLLAELVARSGLPLGAHLERLRARYGRRACGRAACPAGPGAPETLARLADTLPARFDGARVLDVSRTDGLRLELEDGFVLWRASGTEPVLRVYAEASGPRRLARRLAAGLARLGDGGAS